MAVQNLEQKLAQIAISDKGAWLAKAQWREDNRNWLQKSSAIAIKILMKLDELGWSQKTLAEKMGKTPQYINTICKGHENLTLQTIANLEDILDICLSMKPTEVSNKIEMPNFVFTQSFQKLLENFMNKIKVNVDVETQLVTVTSKSVNTIMPINTQANNTVKNEVEDFAMCA
jgi:transcriptional regulator with XRE-family HTH domain